MSKNIKKTSIVKKIGLLSLAGTVLANPLMADLFQDSFMNVTPGGTYKVYDSSGNVKNTVFTTPSLFVRFNQSDTYPEPIFRLSPPQMQVGCNGISIKGLFASIISLDRFSEMLKNAGASFAWGVVVGLVYSLPGVGAAFRMLDQWAKKIQQLMANACQSGIAVGQAIADKTEINDLSAKAESLFSISGDTPTVVTNLENSAQSFLHRYGLNFDSDSMSLSYNSDSSLPSDQILSNYFTAMLNYIIVRSYAGNFITRAISTFPDTAKESFLSNVSVSVNNAADSDKNFKMNAFCIQYDSFAETSIGSSTTVSGSSSNCLIEGAVYPSYSLSAFVKAANLSSISQKALLARNLFSLAFVENYGIDRELKDPASFEVMLNLISSKINDIVHNTTSSTTNDSALTNLLHGDISTFYALSTPISGDFVSEVGRDLANFFYIGTGSGSPLDSNSPLFSMKAIAFYVINMYDPKKQKIVYYFVPVKKDLISTPFIDYSSNSNIKGAKDRSKDIVEGVLEHGIQYLDTAESSSNFMFIVPDLLQKTTILQNASEADREMGKELLMKFNAYWSSLAAIKSILTVKKFGSNMYPIIVYDKSTNSFSKGFIGLTKNQKDISDFDHIIVENQKLFHKIYDSARKRLNEQLKDKEVIQNYVDFENTFLSIQKRNQNRALHSLTK